MKQFLFMVMPLVILVMAFHPVNSYKVTGKVRDGSGNPISDVFVVVKGTKNGTTTSTDGTFSITVASLDVTLVFSSVGYKSIEVNLDGKSTIDATLSIAEKELSEVVVIGYGTQKKKDMTGSVVSVSPKQINSYPVPNNQLMGKTAGIQIRGISSVNGRKSNRMNKPTGFEGDDFNTEGYDNITENRFLKVTDNPLSTFSIDVDAASYSNVRRFINQGQLPPAGAVRIEEMVNYFKYDYPQPEGDQPFSINTEISDAPWNKDHKLVLIGLQGKKIATEKLPASNLVFLIDVSGSMQGPERIGLVKASMKMLVDQLREQDRVAMVVYAGAAGLVLSPTSGSEKTKIKDAIDRLDAGGSTAGGAGIKLAYKTAKEFYIKGGNNRVILCT
ncbi:MAG: von Willebrand factor type A domain-containing protein, partial [Chitinophagales bacterium]